MELFLNVNLLEEIVLPKSISFIGGNVFKDCRNLKKINLSVCDKLEKIEYGSFSGCESLEEIKIPKNITSIGEKAFGGCVNLVKVDFSECDKLEKIGNGAFCDCALFKFAFPKSITELCEQVRSKVVLTYARSIFQNILISATL